MSAFIVAIHILTCITLILVVLLQSGKGADMGAAFGGAGSTVFGPGGGGSVMTKITAVTAITFMATSLTLALMSARTTSLFDDAVEPGAPAASIPGAPSSPPAGIPAQQPEDLVDVSFDAEGQVVDTAPVAAQAPAAPVAVGDSAPAAAPAAGAPASEAPAAAAGAVEGGATAPPPVDQEPSGQ